MSNTKNGTIEKYEGHSGKVTIDSTDHNTMSNGRMPRNMIDPRRQQQKPKPGYMVRRNMNQNSKLNRFNKMM
jgi:hypothetical protein